jgi:DNA-binding response OmpR family regulator
MVEKSTNLEEKIAIISSESISFNEKSLTSAIKNVDDDVPLILVVEDNRDLLYHLSCELFPFYRVTLATDGVEGLNKAIEEIPNLIISDIVMPGIDGIELCRKLKIDERTSHIPIILLTARSLEEHEIEGYKTGADDYITKPFSIPLLLSRINNLIDSRKKLRQKFGNGNDFSPRKVAVNSIDEMFFKKTMHIIEENLSDTGFGPTELTNKLGLSRAQLYRKIKALTNQSVADFIRTMKLNKAAGMLLENKYNINEVAHEVGFTEQSNFTRDFKQQFGQNPTNYISKRKNKNEP